MGRRAAAVCGGAAAVVLSGAVVAACGSGQDQARAACNHVLRSIVLYRQGQRAQSTEAQHDFNLAYAQLRLALPLAAAANSTNGQWNALMTTISESARVDEGHLIVALQAECSATDSNQPYPSAPATGGSATGGTSGG